MKLFSNKKKADSETAVVDGSYHKTIQMIHDEFRTSGERLYREALAIINSAKVPNEEKAERLNALGFHESSEAVAAREVIIKKRLSEHNAEVIKYYRDKYPLYKFIREEDVKGICEKYGLIVGSVSKYTGFVPERNLRELEAFKIDEKDRRVEKIFLGLRDSNEYLTIAKTREYWGQWEREEIRNKERLINLTAGFGDPISNFMRRNDTAYRVERELNIAAPVKDFKLSPWDKVEGYKIVRHVPDPVVLCPVAEGYLIVTAWGDEASDPIIQNELNN